MRKAFEAISPDSADTTPNTSQSVLSAAGNEGSRPEGWVHPPVAASCSAGAFEVERTLPESGGCAGETKMRLKPECPVRSPWLAGSNWRAPREAMATWTTPRDGRTAFDVCETATPGPLLLDPVHEREPSPFLAYFSGARDALRTGDLAASHDAARTLAPTALTGVPDRM